MGLAFYIYLRYEATVCFPPSLLDTVHVQVSRTGESLLPRTLFFFYVGEGENRAWYTLSAHA